MLRTACIASTAPLIAAYLTLTSGASAVEVPDVAGEPMSIDITNTAVTNYRFDNRNSKGTSIATRVDDNYFEWLDRLNVQVGWWRLRLGLRVDAATFAGELSRADARKQAAEEASSDASGADRNDATNQFFRELNTRFVNTYYPSKLWVGYTYGGIDATVGDFYAQLGRGLVFSVRKVDELAVDTTVRGGKIAFDRDLGPIHLGVTAFAGQLNPLRIDETSGRRLNGDGSPLFFGFPKARDLVTYDFDKFGSVIKTTVPARPSYLEDTVIGGRVEAGPSFVQLAANGSMLLRKSYVDENLACAARGEKDCDSTYPTFDNANSPTRNYDTIRTFSGSVNVPSIAKHGDLYVEVAGQQLRDGRLTNETQSGPEERLADISGYAIYGSANVRGGPVTVSLEGKHYRSFFPLAANIDKNTRGFDAPEFDLVAYNQPPTAEPIYVQTLGAPNQCITGGRTRVDVRFTRSASVYGWLGRYVSYSEKQTENTSCDTSAQFQTNTWDAAVGSELDFEKGKSHSRAWIGARLTTEAQTSAEPSTDAPGVTDTFYQEGYIRYDIVKHITGPFSLQMQGFHRRRFEPGFHDVPWVEGENYTALQWSPHLSAIFGYEYVARKECRSGSDASVCHYVSGGLQWKSGSQDRVLKQIFDTVQVFVGQRRGAVRCVSGSCRLFPPFEGAKLEVVSRF